MVSVLYHDNCLDGLGAAYTVWKRYQQSKELNFFPVHHGNPLPQKLDEEIIIVDFSYPIQVLQQIETNATSLLLIDHHKTAQQDLENYQSSNPKCVTTIHFNLVHSGAVLTWKYLFPDKDVPLILQYIEDRDLWKWALPDSEAINAGLRAMNHTFEALDLLVRKNPINELYSLGQIFLEDIKEQSEAIAQMAVRTTVAGIKNIPAINNNKLVSDVCQRMLELYPDAPFVACYFDTGTQKRRWALRSRKDYDCSIVAKRMGGGGHAQACGFEENLLD